MKWVAEIVGDMSEKTVAVDGKTIRSTEHQKHRETPIHIATAYLSELGISLGQRAVEGKTNEIVAVRELLEELDIAGCFVVADALNCQTKTAEIIDEKGGKYILPVKENQKNLHHDIEDFVQDENLQKAMQKSTKQEKNHGRITSRTSFVSNDVSWLPDRQKWAGLTSFGAILTEVEQDGKSSKEWHYYISNAAISADELLTHARLEWGVESMHWLLDVHFDEDRCKVLNENTQQNLNIIRKIVLNALKIHKKNNNLKQPLTMIMADNLFDPQNLLAFFSTSFFQLLLHFCD